jgi:RNA polymerase sigma-70 factor (ECF subfamily)
MEPGLHTHAGVSATHAEVMEPTARDVTRLLAAASAGDPDAVPSLFEALYRELRQLAASTMRSERHDHTLQPTGLVHEAYLRLSDEPLTLENRRHFFQAAAVAMRRILVEHARARGAQKRGGDARRLPLDEVDVAADGGLAHMDLAALDDALTRLAALDPRQARIVELRYFAGLTVEEAADVLALSPRTVKREWQMARAWLRRAIDGP